MNANGQAKSSKPPSAPKGLGARGRGLWRQLTAEFHLDARELSALEVVCNMADQVAALEDVVRVEGLMVAGSKGQPVVNPAQVELRHLQGALLKSLSDIGWPSSDGVPLSPASARGRKAANSRWNRVRADQARREQRTSEGWPATNRPAARERLGPLTAN